MLYISFHSGEVVGAFRYTEVRQMLICPRCRPSLNVGYVHVACCLEELIESY